jgi:hypothetical protein
MVVGYGLVMAAFSTGLFYAGISMGEWDFKSNFTIQPWLNLLRLPLLDDGRYHLICGPSGNFNSYVD